jgi:hypothetical protein
VATLLKPLFESGVEIDFAWRTFRWDSEAHEKAHVHCVIVGFHVGNKKLTQSPRSSQSLDGETSRETKTIYDTDGTAIASKIRLLAIFTTRSQCRLTRFLFSLARSARVSSTA